MIARILGSVGSLVRDSHGVFRRSADQMGHFGDIAAEVFSLPPRALHCRAIERTLVQQIVQR